MNNIKTVFDHGKAFIPFVTAGDPDLKTCLLYTSIRFEGFTDIRFP